ncbi:hypothetical protein MMC06_003902 [Schaereria dolodes]|nr:hypothetical protein [Schaereria dolodes]
MPAHPVFRPNKTALITGSASGIGLAVAKLCHNHGMRLALVDNNAKDLEQAKEFFANDGRSGEVEIYEMDVSKVEEWKGLKEKVLERFGGVDFLMLNAGIGTKGEWEDEGYFHKIFDTNLFGVINGISTFLSTVTTSSNASGSSIVITGSKQGITNPPGNPAYNASKSALKTLAEHLSFDLRDTSTSVHLLIPGWTHTGITSGPPSADGAKKEKPPGAWTPDQVAEYLDQKMENGTFYVLCPDNDTTAEKDRKRMLWSMGDIVEERPPLSRWRENWKERAEEWMAKQKD